MQNLKGRSTEQLNNNNPLCSDEQKNICQLFKFQVEKNPDHIAAIFENQNLSYRELDEKSTTLALFLKEQQVGPEIVVGLGIPSGFNLLIGIIAILKSGGVYFPLDPHYPKERLHYMIQDAKPHLVLTESCYSTQFENYNNQLIHLNDFNWNEMSSMDKVHENQNLPFPRPDNPAYLIYTSGSTGTPKGIMIPYENFPHFSTMHKNYYPSEMIGLVTGSISFDISTLTIFHTLISGGTLCFLKPSPIIDADEVISLINEKSVNYLLCVPSLYSILLEKSQQMPTLKTVSLAGENIPRRIPAQHSTFAPNAFLYNEYAPSECACGATIAMIYSPQEKKIFPITIGKPLPNTEIHLLNEDLQPVSLGEKGEIFIGGAGLALGYLNQPKLTSERFIIVSLAGNEPVRLYKTGDYGRILADGNLEFLGRMDFQVKVRGVRIELAEVENAICQFPSVKEAAVVALKDIQENNRLIGYFLSDSQSDISSKLREYLHQKLPSTMIPSILKQIKQFPRDANGKINRHSLPMISEQPKNPIEENPLLSEVHKVLADIFKKVLHLNEVGMNDNFFDLGGDSLSIISVQTYIETILRINVSIGDLFRYPTVSQLSILLRQNPITTNNEIDTRRTLSERKKTAFQQFRTRAKK